MKTDDEMAASALRHRAEEAEVLAERMEAEGTYIAKPFALREEAAACRRVALRLSPFVSGNHHETRQEVP